MSVQFIKIIMTNGRRTFAILMTLEANKQRQMPGGQWTYAEQLAEVQQESRQ